MAIQLSSSSGSIFERIRNRFRGSGAILLYHSIDMNPLSSSVSPAEFEKQMSLLRQRKSRVITLADMCLRIRHGESVRGCVALAFDGSYTDFFKHAFPVLKRNKFPATIFLSPDKLGGTTYLAQGKISLKSMTADEVRRAVSASDLIDFMPHIFHLDLTRTGLKDQMKEISTSRQKIESLTKKPADILGYSESDLAPSIVARLRNRDLWLAAVTTESGYVKDNSNPFSLRRISIDSATTFTMFKSMISKTI